MTVATESVEDILQPLAEATVRCQDFSHVQSITGGGSCPLCHTRPPQWGGVPDPRLEALWCRHTVKVVYTRHKWVCNNCLADWRGLGLPSIDASLGAIVRAMGACGLYVTFLSASGLVQIESMTYRPGPMRWHGDGATPEEGLARAFVAAWRDEKAASLGPADGG